MKNKLFSLIGLTLVFSLVAAPVLAQDMSATNSPATELAEHVPGELLIRFSPGLDSAQRAEKMAAMGVSHKREISDIGVHLVKIATRVVGRAGACAFQPHAQYRFCRAELHFAYCC